MSDRRLIASAVAAFLAVSLPAAAEVSGLVLEVSGKTDPQLAPYSELQTNATVKLAPDATIKVVHYKSCRTLAVSGGTIEAGPDDFKLADGKIVSNVLGHCPPRMGTKTGSGLGGIVMRGGEPEALPVIPGQIFVFTGDGAGAVQKVSLMRDNKTLSSWKPDGTHSWHLPDGVLKEGDKAVLQIDRKGSDPLTENLLMMKPIGTDVAAKLMVIEVE
jgi:hypothetical protein